MEDLDRDSNSDTEGLVDVGDPFAEFVHDEFVPHSIDDEKSPDSTRSKRKPRKRSLLQSQKSKRKRSSPCSIPQDVSSHYKVIIKLCLITPTSVP